MDKALLKIKLELAKRKVKEKFEAGKEKVKAGIEYVDEHREVVLPLVIGGLAVAKKAAATHATYKEEKDRRTRFWDPRTGRYTYSKRILKDREEQEVETRYRNGESYREILSDMGLTK